MTFIIQFISFLFTIIKSFFDMLRRCPRLAGVSLVALASVLTSTIASAQTLTLRVDIASGSTTGDGSDWHSDAFRFLQDAIVSAHAWIDLNPEGTVEIWIAEGVYSPDQTKENGWFCDDQTTPGPSCCTPYGNCSQGAAFTIWGGYNIHLYGGFAGHETAKD